ncbi:HesA/MoeB/ThiF family protein [Ectothiorhodospira lacustris]|uniref:HesA/MoeB/ThiF family protein n=1 Tax=Ectothiorhodospira lacustris TaxID=2899127 RepID=UPI001EE78D82|nr:molybdopterin-synthase adenylyltransferase MoeB [Ectothiorhodospira lacustris]MCG5500870.1 molybdopterin-synthase adenylyltransferase MoeB [Ectothiorhodospira lacustris]MCG5511396.1 molybdopterin-synthase adenylyltransferase MoeB [Ectothiorhodospira lacustris]MCG5523203.1 molybdopterin-synthase adenylyltransferase MoeB [Ectothiorhodospira lacustris]
MDDETLLRYSRQILLPQVGYEGQERLGRSHALIIGLGGLGSPVALYLAAAGVGRLTLVDFDRVDLSNLQRQIIHRTDRIGRSKVVSAAESITGINPLVQVTCIDQALEGDALARVMDGVDVALDCSDNFATRFAVNRACVATGTPLVSAAVIRLEGQLSVFEPRVADSPCYQCLYGEGDEAAETCSRNGVLASLPGVMGSLQATEALKLLLGLPTVRGRLLLLDALVMEWRSIRVRKDPGCTVCGEGG